MGCCTVIECTYGMVFIELWILVCLWICIQVVQVGNNHFRKKVIHL